MTTTNDKQIKIITQACRTFFNLSPNDIIPDPPITFLYTREEVDKILGRKTEPWVRAITNRNGLFFVDESVVEKITSHKKGNNWGVVHHEMSHWYYDQITGTWDGRPTWLTEGLAEYMAGQKKNLPVPVSESVTKKYFDHTDNEVYQWGTLLVTKLINDYGKTKLLELIKHIGPDTNEGSFARSFHTVYGFTLQSFEDTVKKDLKEKLKGRKSQM